MKFLLKIAAAAAIVSLAAGCCPCRSYQKKTRRPLTGTEWQLIQLGGKSIQPKEGFYTISLSADNKRVWGVGACNRISGVYTAFDNRSLKIGPLASTRMACPDLKQEQSFIQAIESATHYDMDGPMLLLLSNGELRAVFQAIPETK